MDAQAAKMFICAPLIEVVFVTFLTSTRQPVNEALTTGADITTRSLYAEAFSISCPPETGTFPAGHACVIATVSPTNAPKESVFADTIS